MPSVLAVALKPGTTYDETTLRWRKNGVYVPEWDGRKSVYITNTTDADGGVYECYVNGLRYAGLQAIQMLFVRGKLD